MEPKRGEPVKAFATASAFDRWLSRNHKTASSIWVKIAKQGSGVPSITQRELVEVLLCYGWIDSAARSVDATYWLQRCTPRGPRSSWSGINRAHVARLTSAGRMRAAGLAAVRKAKADGRWETA